MPSAALEMTPDEVPEEGLDRGLPDTVTLAAGVDLDTEDPCDVGGTYRLCVAATKRGARCSAPALTNAILCTAHAGRLDASAGGKARAEQLRLVAEEAQERAINARLGTRAIVAAALAEKHAEIRLAVHQLADAAAEGDRQCALALLPYMTQALGLPSTAQATPIPTGDGGEVDLSTLDTAQLKALLAPTP